jgi:hypothetical protein
MSFPQPSRETIDGSAVAALSAAGVGGRRGFLGGGGHSVGESEDRQSRQRSVYFGVIE